MRRGKKTSHTRDWGRRIQIHTHAEMEKPLDDLQWVCTSVFDYETGERVGYAVPGSVASDLANAETLRTERTDEVVTIDATRAWEAVRDGKWVKVPDLPEGCKEELVNIRLVQAMAFLDSDGNLKYDAYNALQKKKWTFKRLLLISAAAAKSVGRFSHLHLLGYENFGGFATPQARSRTRCLRKYLDESTKRSLLSATLRRAVSAMEPIRGGCSTREDRRDAYMHDLREKVGCVSLPPGAVDRVVWRVASENCARRRKRVPEKHPRDLPGTVLATWAEMDEIARGYFEAAQLAVPADPVAAFSRLCPEPTWRETRSGRQVRSTNGMSARQRRWHKLKRHARKISRGAVGAAARDAYWGALHQNHFVHPTVRSLSDIRWSLEAAQGTYAQSGDESGPQLPWCDVLEAASPTKDDGGSECCGGSEVMLNVLQRALRAAYSAPRTKLRRSNTKAVTLAQGSPLTTGPYVRRVLAWIERWRLRVPIPRQRLPLDVYPDGAPVYVARANGGKFGLDVRFVREPQAGLRRFLDHVRGTQAGETLDTLLRMDLPDGVDVLALRFVPVDVRRRVALHLREGDADAAGTVWDAFRVDAPAFDTFARECVPLLSAFVRDQIGRRGWRALVTTRWDSVEAVEAPSALAEAMFRTGRFPDETASAETVSGYKTLVQRWINDEYVGGLPPAVAARYDRGMFMPRHAPKMTVRAAENRSVLRSELNLALFLGVLSDADTLMRLVTDPKACEAFAWETFKKNQFDNRYLK